MLTMLIVLAAHSTVATAPTVQILTDVDGTLHQPPHRHHHHNCIHDEKTDEFAASVNVASLMTPQRLAPHVDSYLQSFVMDDFLDVVGVPVSASAPRRALASAATPAASFQPIRIAFDLSKLSSYVHVSLVLELGDWNSCKRLAPIGTQGICARSRVRPS